MVSYLAGMEHTGFESCACALAGGLPLHNLEEVLLCLSCFGWFEVAIADPNHDVGIIKGFPDKLIKQQPTQKHAGCESSRASQIFFESTAFSIYAL